MSPSPLLNLTTTTRASTYPTVQPSFQIQAPFYDLQPPPFRGQAPLFFPVPTRVPNDDHQLLTTTISEVSLARPTPMPMRLVKRQNVVIEIDIVTVVTVVPAAAAATAASPVIVTLTVPPPTNTQISSGGWPIINPGSAAACWSDMACNSVCPNFQQNGWYAHCIDDACSQCRCQIISGSMCNGMSYKNATWSSDAPAKTISRGPAVATVTVMVASEGGSYLYHHRSSRKTQLMGLVIGLICWFAL